MRALLWPVAIFAECDHRRCHDTRRPEGAVDAATVTTAPLRMLTVGLGERTRKQGPHSEVTDKGRRQPRKTKQLLVQETPKLLFAVLTNLGKLVKTPFKRYDAVYYPNVMN